MMRAVKKERLYISQLIEEPALTYPTYYTLSKYQHQNEFLHDAIISIHSATLSNYKQPKQVDELFLAFKSGRFAIYKEYYIVGFFGGKVMFLEPYGWKSMGMNEGIFDMKNWLV